MNVNQTYQPMTNVPQQAPVQQAPVPQQQIAPVTVLPQQAPQTTPWGAPAVAPTQQVAPIAQPTILPVAPVVAPVAPVVAPTAPVAPAAADGAREQIATFLKTANLNATQVEQEVAALGKPTDSTIKILVDKHGQATTNLILNQISQLAATATASKAALVTMQHDMVAKAFEGVTTQTPAESWTELMTWSRTNIDAGTRTNLNAMLAAGDFQAKQAIDYMINNLKAAQGMEQHGQLLNGDNKVGAPAGTGSLSASAYFREMETVVAKYGYESPERNALDARRTRSAAAGV